MLKNSKDYVHSDDKADYIRKEIQYEKYTDKKFRKYNTRLTKHSE